AGGVITAGTMNTSSSFGRGDDNRLSSYDGRYTLPLRDGGRATLYDPRNPMKVVFFEDVEGTALVGDVKEVKNGFARNYLLPRGIAGPTTPTNLQHANSLAQKEARRQEKLDRDAQVHVDRLEGYTITLEARVGETGRLFGSVTNRDIAE